MADKSIFRRYIEIVLDKVSAQKSERDTQALLNRATNSKQASANLAGVGRAINNVSRLFLQAGAAVAGYALALTRMTERGGQVLNVQRAFTRAVGDADAALAQLRRSTNGLISDYDLMVGLNEALSLRAVKTVEQFGEMASVARDLGKALGVDAAYAMKQLSLGIARHSIKILDNIAITAKATDDFATIMQKARERVDQFGVAQTNAADLMQRMIVQFANLKDAVSKFLAQSDTLKVAFFEAGNVLETIVLSLQTGDIDTAKDAFKRVGTVLGTTFAAAFFDAVSSTLKGIVENSGPLLGPLIGAFLGFAAGGPVGGLVGGAAAIGALGPLPGMLDKAADAARSAADAELVALEALKGQVEAALRLRALRTPPGQGTAGRGGVAPTTGLARNTGFDARREEFFNLAHSLVFGVSNIDTTPPKTLGTSATGEERFARLVDHFRTGFADIESAGQTAALGIEDAFARALGRIGDEGVTVGSIMEEVFRGIAASGLGAIAQYATGKVTEDVAHAFDEFAKATASAATGNLPGAALHTSAAHGFLLGAAKWAVAGGVASAAAGAVGGSGASDFRGSDVTGREIDKLDAKGAVVNVYVDGMDPRNARHQRVVYETVAAAQKSAGKNATVNIFPRGN